MRDKGCRPENGRPVLSPKCGVRKKRFAGKRDEPRANRQIPTAKEENADCEGSMANVRNLSGLTLADLNLIIRNPQFP